MTDAEKVLRKTIREYAQNNNATVINIWRERRKGPQFISGRQLKVRVLSADFENIQRMGDELSKWYGFICVFEKTPYHVQRYAPADAYLTFTQTKNSLRIE